MNRKRLYLVQVNQRYGENVYVPYSVGCVWAYARTIPAIQDAYEFCGFLYLKEPIARAVAKLDNPDLVCLSLYIWNERWSCELAKAVKARWPNCKVLVGGVSVWDESTRTLDDHPCYDFAIYGEGEGAFADFLVEHAKESPSYSACGSLVYRDEDGLARANKRRAFIELDKLRSPYLDGVFDPILPMERRWQTLAETNRGCPYFLLILCMGIRCSQ